MAFDEGFFNARLRKQAGWAASGIRSGSGRPFAVPGDEACQSQVADPQTGRTTVKRKKKSGAGSRLGEPGYVSPHAKALAYLAKHPEARQGNQEFYEQCLVFATVEVEDPELYELMAAVPNGGYRTPKAAGERKAEGQKKGYPDIVVDLPAGVYHGARIEMKAEGGAASAEQKERLRLLSERGYYCALCVGADEALLVLRRYRRLQPCEQMPERERDKVWRVAA